MLLTGEAITAEEAKQYGLVNKIVNENELESKSIEFAEKIAVTPNDIISIGKEAFYKQISMSVKDAYQVAEGVMVDNLFVDNTVEGINAFVQKRDPSWKSKNRN